MTNTEENTYEISIVVRLFAGLREKAGTASLHLHLKDGATVKDALDALMETKKVRLSENMRFTTAVNNEYAREDYRLQQNDELALIPPVSGGDESIIVITSKPLTPEIYTRSVIAPSCGAIVTFTGVTREENEGRKVLFLEYEAYKVMAESKMREIVSEMKMKWGYLRVAVGHRTGRVEVGDISMVLAVAAPHRRAAFESSLYFVDRLKQIVPIWKSEHFKGGSVWIGDTPG